MAQWYESCNKFIHILITVPAIFWSNLLVKSIILPMPLRLKAESMPSGMPFQESAISFGKPESIVLLVSSYL